MRQLFWRKKGGSHLEGWRWKSKNLKGMPKKKRGKKVS